MYAIQQIVNLWSPNPIQYNLVLYKSFEESTTKRFTTAERSPACWLWQRRALRIAGPAADPTLPRRLHALLQLIQLEPNALTLAETSASIPAGKVLGDPGADGAVPLLAPVR